METTTAASRRVSYSPYKHFVDWLADREMSYEQWLRLPAADSDSYFRAWKESPHPVHGTIINAIYFTLLTEPDAEGVFRLIATVPPVEAAEPATPTVETTEAIHIPIEYTDPDPGNIPVGLGWPRDDEGALRIRAYKAGLRGEGSVADLPPGIVPAAKRPTIWDNRWNPLGFLFLGLILGLLMWDYLN